MRILVLVVIAASFAIGCSEDRPELAGMWRVVTHTHNATGCETQGPPVTDVPFVALVHEVPGDEETLVFRECDDATLESCIPAGNDTPAFIVRSPGGYVAHIVWAGQEGHTCTRGIIDATLVLEAGDTLLVLIRRWGSTVTLSPGESCNLVDWDDPNLTLPCVGYDVIRATRVAGP